MAFPPMYAQQAKGTLMPGQMIAVNKYNVQVEKYLSQGGFAHVYLVRTAEPVFNTTHHVLKRIAVANEAMLNDVKKEVDIMRILRGHPNIVYLIDAAWHRMPTGMYEVFILMEFCSGGGIIDMMNRRLRERLTEAEILQIFVDVCEGVAAMHNLRPSLLHRDLKVENILQASATSFKLCDFGSAIPVAAKPPSTTQEIRALEADLNKHTTLQYRAPEMVDVFLRRPVDEKSDVWALGVLLYKLCYYTTPFEEHGVLAILNVQYKFPPYPVYSQQLNALIASMLREHNVHRPSVFEVLDTVHQMRGTKSRFTYNPPKQVLSPRATASPVPMRNMTPASAKFPEPIESPPMNGIQAREKVLDAIAPMRRGRPSSPTRGRKASDDAFNLLDSVEGGPWNSRPAKAHKSGMAAISSARSPPPLSAGSSGLGDAWQVPGVKSDWRQPTGSGNGFADAFDARAQLSSSPVTVPAPRPAPVRAGSSLRPPGSDAFESLSLFPSPQSQILTLGEAQKAAQSGPRPSPSPQPNNQKYSVPPSPSYKSPSPNPTGNYMPRRDASPLLQQKPSDQALAAEQRFPSLEELDSGKFGSLPNSGSISAPATAPAPSPAPPQLPPRPVARQDSSTSFYPASVTGALRPPSGMKGSPSTAPRYDGVRSQQVTGTAMRDARKFQAPSIIPSTSTSSADRSKHEQPGTRPSRMEAPAREKLQSPSRPMLSRKHRSSMSIKHTARTGSDASPPKPVTGLPVTSDEPKDWLTGPTNGSGGMSFENTAVLRASPEKRTSVLMSSGPPDVGRVASLRETTPSPTKRKPVPTYRPKPIELKKPEPEANKEKLGGLSAGLTENWSPKSSSSSEDVDDGPEDASGTARPSRGLIKDQVQQRIGHKGRQGSVHDLVDLWGGSGSSQSPKPTPTKQDKRNSMFSAPSGNGVTLDAALERIRTSSPAPASITSSTILKHGEKPSSTKPTAPVSRKPSLASRHTPTNHLRHPPSPIKSQRSSPSPSASRSRPQSMLILPVQKAASEMTPPSPSVKASLSPPPNKLRSSQRRSSISDLVSRYESFDVQSKSGKPGVLSQQGAPAPAPAAKPARLRVASPPMASPSASLVSPSAASARFPRISPTSSPKEPAKNILSTELDPPGRASFSKESTVRRAVSPSPGLQAASGFLSRQNSLKDKDASPNVISIATRSIQEPTRVERKPLVGLSNALSINEPSASELVNPSREEETSPPSPEKPYQGVSRLIDQWQKKTSETDGSKSGGGAAGLKGTGSRFRREGITAGGGKAS